MIKWFFDKLTMLVLDFMMSIQTILEQNSELQNLRLKSFLEFFPVAKDKTIQIDLKSIKDAAMQQAKKYNTTLSKQQLDKIFKKDISSIAYAILPLNSCEAGSVGSGLHVAGNALSYNGDIEFYIRQTEIISNSNNRERLGTVAHSAYNINNLHFFVKNIRQWLLCEDVKLVNQSQQSKIEEIFMKHYFDQDDDYLNVNQKNFNQLSDFGFALQNWIESL